MELSVEARNVGAVEWLDNDGYPCRKGTFLMASAHIITAIISSGVLSLAWAIAQLGWVAGPAVMLLATRPRRTLRGPHVGRWRGTSPSSAKVVVAAHGPTSYKPSLEYDTGFPETKGNDDNTP
ncbi:hypothetical protein C2845_PM01G41480 [Panicum miliaceum]|uniref:Amino acid transporter transmembrane domain-containing protein n=1 Tax=Panicum miliaceum TaxID=4540 RepID=A0A3L6TH62_PANMI|nr:hypothetical protein C2845_PM01G41480 [Panicum miliaceum]